MFKKEIKKITKGIIVGSIILIGTAGVYAANSTIKTYISNFSASDSEIGKLINGFFDGEGYIEPEFVKDGSLSGDKITDNSITGDKITDNSITGDKITDNSITGDKIVNTEIQKRIIESCPVDKAIQSISVNGTVTCVGSGSLGGGGTPTTGGKFVDGTNTADAVYTTGNVGIGTNSPSAKLEIKHNGNGLLLKRDGYDTYGFEQSPGVGLNIKNYTDNRSELYFKGNGNIGIGTNDPKTKLNIVGGGDASLSADGYMVLGSKNSTNIVIDNNEIIARNNGSTSSIYIQAEGGNTIINETSGNLGIGTSTPSTKLHINSTADVGGGSSANGVLMIGTSAGSHLSMDNNEIMTKNGNGTAPLYINNDGGDTTFGGDIRLKGRDLMFGDGKQLIYGDNSSAFYIDSNNSTGTQMIFRDKENKIYGRIYGASNGDNFGFLDGDGNRSYRAYKDHTTYFYINNSVKMYINSDGSVHAKSFVYTSDRRLKKGIKTLNNSLEKINKLRGVNFRWKNDNKKEIGLIAQEVEEVYPDLVDTNEEDGMKSVKYGNIVAILIEGVKELYNKVVGNTDEIEKLKIENTELKNRLELLEGKIDKLIK